MIYIAFAIGTIIGVFVGAFFASAGKKRIILLPANKKMSNKEISEFLLRRKYQSFY